MIIEKKITLRPILESSEGIHLTAYLINRGDLADLKTQLRETLNEAYEWLHAVQTIEERNRFLEPLDALLKDARILKSMKGNIGLFRTKDSFRVLNVPVEVERQCHVANSFHVKPLLRWMQVDRDFLLIGLQQDSAHLYLGNQTSMQKVDSILFPEFFKQKNMFDDYLSLKKARQLKVKRDETFAWLSEWLDQMTQKATPRLYMAGENNLVEGFLKNLKYRNVVKNPVAASFGEHNLSEICAGIRKTLKSEAKGTLEKELLGFRVAEDLSMAKKNVFQIAKSAVKGKVKKLVIADDMKIYGKMDKKTGGLAIHPFDLDHEDDDILDDLAQTVLASGGEVIIAPRSEIPKNRVALAIVEGEGPSLEKTEVFEEPEMLQERSAL